LWGFVIKQFNSTSGKCQHKKKYASKNQVKQMNNNYYRCNSKSINSRNKLKILNTIHIIILRIIILQINVNRLKILVGKIWMQFQETLWVHYLWIFVLETLNKFTLWSRYQRIRMFESKSIKRNTMEIFREITNGILLLFFMVWVIITRL
jgi:hypothetical protein